MKNKSSIIKLCLVFIIPLFLFQNCSKESIEEIEAKQLETLIDNNPEQAYPGFIGEIVTINFRGVDIQVMKKDNEYIFQGDIIISQEDLDEYSNKSSNIKSAVESGSAYRWPSNTVYFTINSGLPLQSRVIDAIAHWEAYTALTFIQRTTQSDYIEFVAAGFCASNSIGKKGGKQSIFLGPGCSTGNTIHEIGHAIGLYHEHTREDRDSHVQINWANIINNPIDGDFSPQFVKYNLITNATGTGQDIGAFDFGSIMMYSSNAFTTNGLPTIEKLDGSTFTAQRTGLSAGDKEGIFYLYPLPPIPSISGPDYMGIGVDAIAWTYYGGVPNAQTFIWWYKKINNGGVAPIAISYGSSGYFVATLDTYYSNASHGTSDFEIFLEVIDTNGNSYTSSTSSIMKKGKYKLEGLL